MNIGKMTEQDINAIVQLQAADIKYLEKYSRAQFLEMLNDKNYYMLTAKDGESVGGYLIAKCGVDELELYQIVVGTSNKRSGVGSQLIKNLPDFAKINNINSIYLEVRVDNENAIAFYKALGFIGVGRRKGYYYGSMDAILMNYKIEQ